jgi:hypothetical protein
MYCRQDHPYDMGRMSAGREVEAKEKCSGRLPELRADAPHRIAEAMADDALSLTFGVSGARFPPGYCFRGIASGVVGTVGMTTAEHG